MSYTRPLGSAANLSWLNSTAYTRPSGGGADLKWDSGTGFLVTKFGTPSTPLPATGWKATKIGSASVPLPATGFSSTAFAKPSVLGVYGASALHATTFGTPYAPSSAKGFQATVMGVPSKPLKASGASSTGVGTPIGKQVWYQTSLPPTTVVSQAWRAVAQAATASSLHPTAFGYASMMTTTTTLSVVTYLRGWSVTRWGSPTAHASAVLVEAGRASASVGTPTSGRGVRAGGTASTAFGVPSAPRVFAATGWFAVHVPPPAAKAPKGVVGWAVTKFGAARKAGHYGRAYPIRAVVFGRPKGVTNLGRSTGMRSTTFGAVGASMTHRASHLAPQTHFGQPTKLRATAC